MNLENIFLNLKGSSKTRKLEAIADYVEENYNKRYEFEKPEDIFNIGIDYNEEDYEKLLDIVTSNYSKHSPFYIYKMYFKGNKNVNDLEQLLKQMSETIEDYDVDERYKFTKVEFKKKEILEIAIRYEQYNIFYKETNLEREGVVKKGTIRVIFNTKENYLYINIGEDRKNNIARKFLNRILYTCIDIEPLYVAASNIRYTGPIENDRVTIFLLELLSQKLNEKNNFIINDYIKIGILKPNNENVKSMMIRGNNLLEDKETAIKIQNGFKLKAVDFSFSYIQENKSDALNFTVSINIQSTVKISIIETTNRNRNLDIIKEISDNMIDLLNTEISLKTDIITHYFNGVKSTMEAQKEAMVYNIMSKIEQHEELKQYLGKLEKIIKSAI